MGQDDGRPDIGKLADAGIVGEADEDNAWAKFVKSHFDPAKAAPVAVRDRGRRFIRGAGGAMIPVQHIASPRQVRAHRMMRQKP